MSQNLKLILSSSLFSIIGCVPLFFYMDSKRHLRESSYHLGVSCPFMNHYSQMNRHTPSRTQCAQTNLCACQPSRPLGSVCPNLGALLMPTHPNLFGGPSLVLRLMLGQSPWQVHMPKVPTCPPSATLGCRSNPKFRLLEDLGEGARALLDEYLTSPPPQVVVSSDNIHKICDLQVSARTFAPITTKSIGNPKFHANWKPQILPKWKPQVSLRSGNPKFPTCIAIICNMCNHPRCPLPKVVCNQIYLLHWKDVSSPTMSVMSKLSLSCCNYHTSFCCCCNLNQNFKNL
jgi:hypothetical protein